jgi:hypothetical protein
VYTLVEIIKVLHTQLLPICNLQHTTSYYIILHPTTSHYIALHPTTSHYITGHLNKLTARSRVLEKSLVTLLVKKFPVFYGTRRVTAVPLRQMNAMHNPLPHSFNIQCNVRLVPFRLSDQNSCVIAPVRATCRLITSSLILAC